MNELTHAIARLREFPTHNRPIDLNHLVLRLIRALDQHSNAHEQPVLNIIAGEERDLFRQIIDWLCDMGILKTGPNGVLMSDQGVFALNEAKQTNPEVADFMACRCAVDPALTANMMLTIMRCHFHTRYVTA